MSQGPGFASPGPAGLGALAVVCFGFGAAFTGKVPLEGLLLLAAWLFGGCLIQIVTSIIELKEGNLTGGNIMLFFSAFFMFSSGLGMIAKFVMITMGMVPSVVIEGYLWAGAAAFLTICTPAYARQNAIMFVLVIVVDVILWMLAGIDTNILPATYKHPLGYALFGVGIVGIYMSGAAMVNTVYGKMLLPIPAAVSKQSPNKAA